MRVKFLDLAHDACDDEGSYKVVMRGLDRLDPDIAAARGKVHAPPHHQANITEAEEALIAARCVEAYPRPLRCLARC